MNRKTENRLSCKEEVNAVILPRLVRIHAYGDSFNKNIRHLHFFSEIKCDHMVNKRH